MGRVLTLALACITLAGSVPAQAEDAEGTSGVLLPAIADARAHFGRKQATLGSLQKRMPLSVRIALNRWAPVAMALGMDMAVGQKAEVVLIGTVPGDQLEEAALWMDEAAELLEPLALGSDATNEDRANLAGALGNLSVAERAQGRFDAGAAHAAHAFELLERTIRESPHDRLARATLASLLANESTMWRLAGVEITKCEDYARRGLELIEGLLRDHPNAVVFADRSAAGK